MRTIIPALALLAAACAQPEPFECTAPEECAVYWDDCCLYGEHIAIRRDRAGAWRAERCPGTDEGPRSLAPGCIAICIPGDPNDIATCIAGRCELLNVDRQHWNECATDADCVVVPRACDLCGDLFLCFGRGAAIAIASRDEYEHAICSAGLPADCAPPGNAVCRDGRCTTE